GRDHRQPAAARQIQADASRVPRGGPRVLHPPRHDLPDGQHRDAGRDAGGELSKEAGVGEIMLLGDIINMLPWWQWGLLGLVPPAIIALYFLKLRRLPLEVPSTYLWSRTIEDLHV